MRQRGSHRGMLVLGTGRTALLVSPWKEGARLPQTPEEQGQCPGEVPPLDTKAGLQQDASEPMRPPLAVLGQPRCPTLPWQPSSSGITQAGFLTGSLRQLGQSPATEFWLSPALEGCEVVGQKAPVTWLAEARAHKYAFQKTVVKAQSGKKTILSMTASFSLL